MSVKNSAIRFLLGVEKLTCAFDGKELRFPFYKLVGFPQYNYFTWHWLKQFYVGDNQVLRFCDFDCFLKFASGGRLKEMKA